MAGQRMKFTFLLYLYTDGFRKFFSYFPVRSTLFDVKDRWKFINSPLRSDEKINITNTKTTTTSLTDC
jgi:hypothetical protein